MSAAGRLDRPLKQLARLCGVQIAYRHIDGSSGRASPEALRAVLAAFGVDASSPRRVVDAIRMRRRASWDRVIEPVVVSWDGALKIKVRTPAPSKDEPIAWRLELESGEVRTGTLRAVQSRVTALRTVDGDRRVERSARLPLPVPAGWHRLEVRLGRSTGRASVIASSSIDPAGTRADARGWGVFLPLYALRDGGWGAGDFSGLGRLMEWVAGCGGEAVVTLPLFPAFLDTPFDPSPYAPVSRLFWNELYLDLERAPELARAPSARALVDSAEFRSAVSRLRRASQVDYRALAALKWRAIERLAPAFFARPRDGAGRKRRAAFDALRSRRPELDDYARFRGACAKLGHFWKRWPRRPRDGDLQPGDVDESVARAHLYAQWLAEEQLGRVVEEGRARGTGLAIDLPLGIHPDGYDAWRYRESFAPAASAGAPPDPFFSKGQNWGVPPLHPERIREQGHRYFHRLLGNALRHARFLRIDHVMGLHRLFWIPSGFPATEGVYVRYPAQELYAALSLESRRHGARILGENLGTVPGYVNAALSRHGVRPLYVMQVESTRDRRRPVRPVPPGAVASLNTHDMPTFAGFWTGRDLEDHARTGLLTPEEAAKGRKARDAMRRALAGFLRRERHLPGGRAGLASLREACHRFLAVSPARLVVANLEDLWLETAPQNIPGTGHEAGNWQRKARFSLSVLIMDRAVRSSMAALSRLRPRGRS